MNIQQFTVSNRIRMTVEWADSNPNIAADAKWMASARHFRCVLKCGKRQLTIPFSQGAAHEKEPTASDVLDCLAMDAIGVENARSFEEWCAEYGYDTDSRKAEKIFQVCEREAEGLRRLLGPEAYEQLLWKVERC
jgi:hypothetical protein